MAASRPGGHGASGIAVPAGLLIAEGLVLGSQVPNDPAARALLAIEVLLGLVLPAFLVRGARWRLIAYAGTAAVAGAGIVGLLIVLPALRTAADTF